MTAQPENQQNSVAEGQEKVSQFEVLPGGRSAPTATTLSNGSSQRKTEANRRNAQQSTGPKTPAGQARSSWNSLRHGLLSKRLPETSEHNKKQVFRLLTCLRRDLEPVGTLEEVLVEKIAHEYWRLGIAAWHETDQFMCFRKPFAMSAIENVSRYQTAINRQLYQAINQLERLQRLRRGEQVPAPVSVQLSHDGPSILVEENSGP